MELKALALLKEPPDVLAQLMLILNGIERENNQYEELKRAIKDVNPQWN